MRHPLVQCVAERLNRRSFDLPFRHRRVHDLTTVDRFDEMRGRTGEARASVQELIAFVPREAARADIASAAERRFGTGPGSACVGDAAQLIDHYAARRAQGVKRFYVWFADFAPLSTLAAFGEQVIAPRTAGG